MLRTKSHWVQHLPEPCLAALQPPYLSRRTIFVQGNTKRYQILTKLSSYSGVFIKRSTRHTQKEIHQQVTGFYVWRVREEA